MGIERHLLTLTLIPRRKVVGIPSSSESFLSLILLLSAQSHPPFTDGIDKAGPLYQSPPGLTIEIVNRILRFDR
jgi:hypothetical protein